MKKVFLFLLIMCPLVGNLHAQNTVQEETETIVFEKLIHDYGTIVQGGDGYCEFMFTNKGNVPLLLTDIKASCGCTAPEWPKEAIAPGATGTIKVKYNTNILGAFNKSIMVYSNAVNSNVTLRIKGTVVAKEQTLNN